VPPFVVYATKGGRGGASWLVAENMRADYDDLRKKHGPAWDKAKDAEAHVFFFGDDDDRAYLEAIIQG
jgi:hypothetical protein